MLVIIDGLLSPDTVQSVGSILKDAKFISGAHSAGKMATQVKNNTELPVDASQCNKLNQLVMGALVNHPTFKNAALPHRVAAPYYSCYTSGMQYGEHIDDPIMGEGALYRSDVSITVFLSNPSHYDGGELCVKTGFGEQQIKLPAGSAVLYPSSSLHRVNEVSRGIRYAAVTWVQSLVKRADQREILFDLASVRDELTTQAPEADNTSRIEHSYVNLVRMWSEV